MSSPTGPEQNYPQGGAPEGQPSWGAPEQPTQGYTPAPSYSGAPAGYGAPTAQRPGMVTAAAVIGIVIGALGVLGLFAIGLYFAFNVVLGLLSLLSVVAAVVTLVGGIQAIQGKSPRLLVLGSYASVGVQLLTFIWALVSGYGFVFLGLLGLILPGLIVFLLMQPQSKQYYASRGITY
ncbi:MAG: hypothetical protein ACXVX8_13625 [Blastococcus sp.]